MARSWVMHEAWMAARYGVRWACALGSKGRTVPGCAMMGAGGQGEAYGFAGERQDRRLPWMGWLAGEDGRGHVSPGSRGRTPSQLVDLVLSSGQRPGQNPSKRACCSSHAFHASAHGSMDKRHETGEHMTPCAKGL